MQEWHWEKSENVKDRNGSLLTNANDKRVRWKEYFEKFMNGHGVNVAHVNMIGFRNQEGET